MGKGGGDNLVLGICEVHYDVLSVNTLKIQSAPVHLKVTFTNTQDSKWKFKRMWYKNKNKNMMKLLTHNHIFSFQM